jgi:hypothetical protein
MTFDAVSYLKIAYSIGMNGEQGTRIFLNPRALMFVQGKPITAPLMVPSLNPCWLVALRGYVSRKNCGPHGLTLEGAEQRGKKQFPNFPGQLLRCMFLAIPQMSCTKSNCGAARSLAKSSVSTPFTMHESKSMIAQSMG